MVTLRQLVEVNKLHELFLNLRVDLMLRASDLLNLKFSDVLNESDWVRKEVRLKMKKTKKATLNVPLSKNFISVFKKYQLEMKKKDFIFKSTHYHYKRKPLSTYQSVFPNLQELVERFSCGSCFRIIHSFHSKNEKFGHLWQNKECGCSEKVTWTVFSDCYQCQIWYFWLGCIRPRWTINIWWWKFRIRKNLISSQILEKGPTEFIFLLFKFKKEEIIVV